MNFILVIVACLRAAVSGAGGQDRHVTDACIKPVRDHSLMQRGVRGLDSELRALSQSVRSGTQDQGIIDTIVEEVEDSVSGDSSSDKSSKKHHHKQHNGSNHSKTNASNTSVRNGSFSKDGCVVTHWVSDHDGQVGTIIDIKNHQKFFKVFFEDQLEEWIPKEYLSPLACPGVKVHDCVKVDWVSDHDGELVTVMDIQKHHGEKIGQVKFADTQEEWIPLDSMNYSFKACPTAAGGNASNPSNSPALEHNHSHNVSHKNHHKNLSNSSANNHTNSSHKNQSKSSTHNHTNGTKSSAHNHTNGTSHKKVSESSGHKGSKSTNSSSNQSNKTTKNTE